jgi:hypothetical protein
MIRRLCQKHIIIQKRLTFCLWSAETEGSLCALLQNGDLTHFCLVKALKLDYDGQSTEKCMPMLENNKKQVQEIEEGEISDFSKLVRKKVLHQFVK